MFAAVCVLLAATGHILMSGQAVPGGTLVLASAGTGGAAWLLAGRERGLLAVTTAAVAVQSALHAVFTWSQPPAPASAMPAVPATPMMPGMPSMTSLPGGDSHLTADHAHLAHMAMGHVDLVPPSPHDMTEMSSTLGMLSAHLLAALLSGLWLAQGERAAFRLLRARPLPLFRPLLLLLAASVVVTGPPTRRLLLPARAADEPAPPLLLLAHSVISRGPPPALAVL
ncbi:hypothetical protein ACIRQF_10020 [Streptomyces sp. NPDC101191]|uniref:hypothetical protein n=1 Tax=Streptomyces sp. NPDC101191 TaxID=3366126 RepID=UPI003825CDC0